MKMNKIASLVSAATLAMAAMPASAVLFAVPGGTIDIPIGVDIQVASSFENVVLLPGDVLSGVGEVALINGFATSSLCSSACELTFRFTSYITDLISPTSASFKGGTVDFYLAFGANVDFNPSTSASSAADLAAATNGTLFLNAIGHPVDALGHTLVANGTILPPAVITFSGNGLLSVGPGAGVANVNFNTNAIPSLFGGPADFVLTTTGSSLAPPHPAEGCPAPSPECITGSANLQGVVVPEPGTLALLGLGLAGLGFGAARRKKAV